MSELVRCHYCGCETRPTRDHIVPRCLYSEGSSAPFGRRRVNKIIPANIILACEPCNNAKGSLRVIHDCLICEAAWDAYGPVSHESITLAALLRKRERLVDHP